MSNVFERREFSRRFLLQTAAGTVTAESLRRLFVSQPVNAESHPEVFSNIPVCSVDFHSRGRILAKQALENQPDQQAAEPIPPVVIDSTMPTYGNVNIHLPRNPNLPIKGIHLKGNFIKFADSQISQETQEKINSLMFYGLKSQVAPLSHFFGIPVTFTLSDSPIFIDRNYGEFEQTSGESLYQLIQPRTNAESFSGGTYPLSVNVYDAALPKEGSDQSKVENAWRYLNNRGNTTPNELGYNRGGYTLLMSGMLFGEKEVNAFPYVALHEILHAMGILQHNLDDQKSIMTPNPASLEGRPTGVDNFDVSQICNSLRTPKE